MGVIRWRKVFGADFGEFGDGSICRVTDVLNGWRLELYQAFPGVKAAQLIFDDVDLRFNSKALAKDHAEALLHDWLDAAKLVPRADFDYLQKCHDGLKAHNEKVFELLQERIRYAETVSAQAEATRLSYISCIEVIDDLHTRMADLVEENSDLKAKLTDLKERIGSAFGDIDDAITVLKRKVDDIVADTGVDRSYSWDVPVDQWWNGGKGPKQRTEVDFRNADIDANGYVIFRDGGAA